MTVPSATAGAFRGASGPGPFRRLAPSRKRLTDTVKLLAYRAETALTMIVREELSYADETRALIRDLFRSDADLHPDSGRRRADRAIAHPGQPTLQPGHSALAGAPQSHRAHLPRYQPATEIRTDRHPSNPPLGPILVSDEIRRSETLSPSPRPTEKPPQHPLLAAGKADGQGCRSAATRL